MGMHSTGTESTGSESLSRQAVAELMRLISEIAEQAKLDSQANKVPLPDEMVASFTQVSDIIWRRPRGLATQDEMQYADEWMAAFRAYVAVHIGDAKTIRYFAHAYLGMDPKEREKRVKVEVDTGDKLNFADAISDGSNRDLNGHDRKGEEEGPAYDDHFLMLTLWDSPTKKCKWYRPDVESPTAYIYRAVKNTMTDDYYSYEKLWLDLPHVHSLSNSAEVDVEYTISDLLGGNVRTLSFKEHAQFEPAIAAVDTNETFRDLNGRPYAAGPFDIYDRRAGKNRTYYLYRTPPSASTLDYSDANLHILSPELLYDKFEQENLRISALKKSILRNRHDADSVIEALLGRMEGLSWKEIQKEQGWSAKKRESVRVTLGRVRKALQGGYAYDEGTGEFHQTK